MVKIEKIVIQGFKSFKRKTSIPFSDGFSVVTGPNGSGKTNVSDAICFVIGKSSSRALRAKKTHNLIFHGSKKKEGSDHASVTIYFDNSDKTVPINEKTVSIGRRINKNGVSTYRLNGKVVTRQQIIDVFSQAGVHPDGQNIIQQGDVTQVVEMDSQQRRSIIDDIAGITEYDDKKNKAEKELNKIGEKVKEAEIVLHERETILERLQRDRDSAVQYKNLETELNNLRAALLWKSYSDTESGLKKIENDIQEKTKESDLLEKEIKDHDSKLELEEKALEELTKDVIQASGQIEVTKSIARLQGEIDSKKSRIESSKREIERLGMMVDKLKSMDRRVHPEFKQLLSFDGVKGFLSDLLDIPSKYNTAVDVAAGSHMRDVVVDSTTTAVKCVKYLKENRIGRSRFLPMDKIRPYPKKPLPTGSLGWLSELVHHEPAYNEIVEYVLGSTACVKDIDKAKDIARKTRVRMVTLDGDLMEASGAITGGFLRKKNSGPDADLTKYMSDRKSLASNIGQLEAEVLQLNRQLNIYASKEKKTDTASIERSRVKFDENVKKVREARKDAYERRLVLQQEIGKLNIKRARLEADFDNYKVQINPDDEQKVAEELEKMSVHVIKGKQREVIEQIEALGPVNMKAISEFDLIRNEFVEFKEKVDKIVSEKNSIEETISQIEGKKKVVFDKTLNEISKHFRTIYKELTQGEADIALEDPNSLDSGLQIKASPLGKSLLSIDSMSGGEKTLTAFAFLFAIQNHKPKPFYILDEADAALDKTNTKRIVELIKRHTKQAQFIVISHNDALVKEADQVYGVSMDDGESKVMGLKLPEIPTN
ncbi:MAG: chromosome segregation SMC family protein [Candidatus Aenigmatarchaeota archaeon]